MKQQSKIITEKTIAPKFYGVNAGRAMFMAWGDDPRFTGFGWSQAEAIQQLNERIACAA